MALKGLFRRRRFDVEVERAFRARPRTIWDRLMRVTWLDGEAQWKQGADFILWDGTRIKVRDLRPPHRISFWWIPQVGDRTPVDVHVALQPNGTTAVRFHQRGLTSDEAQRRFRARWKNVLQSLADALK